MSTAGPVEALREILAALERLGLSPQLVGRAATFFPTGPAPPGAPLPPAAAPAPAAPAAPAVPAAPAAPSVPTAPAAPAHAGPAPAATSRADPAAPTATAPPPAASRVGPAAVGVAAGEVGTVEDPPHSNAGPRVDDYTGGQREPWCAHFVSWCFEQGSRSPFGHQASVPDLREWARRHGVYQRADGAKPERGDVFTMARYDKRGTLVGGHTGFVESTTSDGKVRTIEGNLGDGVKRFTRSIDALEGFIRL